MALDGINQRQEVTQQQNVQYDPAAGGDTTVGEKAEKLNAELQGGLNGTASKTPEKETAKMERKEAKAWIKQYMADHPEASKKEAKEAFQEEFGYKMPGSKFMKYVRTVLIHNYVGIIFAGIHGKDETKNFINTGKWNPEA